MAGRTSDFMELPAMTASAGPVPWRLKTRS